MTNQQRQIEYAIDQHDLACITLEISSCHDDCGDTLFEAVVALMKDRDDWKEEAALQSKETDEAREQLDVWKHEAEIIRAELKKADDALEDNITTFLDLREQLTAERALVDRLGELLELYHHGDDEQSMEALTAWKEARK